VVNVTPEVVALVSSFFLALASFFDLKTGEIPEKVSRGFIVSVIFLALAETLLSSNTGPLLWAAVMGVGFFLVGYVMFYLGEWGGGDVKILAGAGCSIGFLGAVGYFQGFSVFPYYVSYFINFALSASPYVIAYTFLLGLQKPEVFRGFASTVSEKKVILIIVLSVLPAALAAYLQMPWMAAPMLAVPLLVVLSFYLLAVENIALQKTIKVSELREEDIIAKDLVVDGKTIASRRGAGGLSGEQLSRIRELAAAGRIPDSIGIRWGIRFAPVFFLAFLLTYMWGDVLELLMRALMA
jgi:Flp pilus assembly protein protease CpaA